MHAVRAVPRLRRAIHAASELLSKLRIEGMYVGVVAESAWLGTEAGSGPVDVIALMTAEQRNQLAMMASNRGFRVVREELEAAEELDVVPLTFPDAEGDVRLHVLLASNALYGRMVAAAATSKLDERELKIPQAEDLALMLLMGDSHDPVRRLRALDGFDEVRFQQKLVSIGLGGMVSG